MGEAEAGEVYNGPGGQLFSGNMFFKSSLTIRGVGEETKQNTPQKQNQQQKQPLTFLFETAQLMAGWLYIIKQAAGEMPGEATPAKTHSLNTMFQEAVTHGILGEEHPEEGLQLLPPCLYCPLHSGSLAERRNVLISGFQHPLSTRGL